LKTITIIDTFGFFFRSYYALPPLRNTEGFPTGLLTGFVNLIDSLRRDHGTDYLVFALDSKGKTLRNEIYCGCCIATSSSFRKKEDVEGGIGRGRTYIT